MSCATLRFMEVSTCPWPRSWPGEEPTGPVGRTRSDARCVTPPVLRVEPQPFYRVFPEGIDPMPMVMGSAMIRCEYPA